MRRGKKKLIEREKGGGRSDGKEGKGERGER